MLWLLFTRPTDVYRLQWGFGTVLAVDIEGRHSGMLQFSSERTELQMQGANSVYNGGV